MADIVEFLVRMQEGLGPLQKTGLPFTPLNLP